MLKTTTTAAVWRVVVFVLLSTAVLGRPLRIQDLYPEHTPDSAWSWIRTTNCSEDHDAPLCGGIVGYACDDNNENTFVVSNLTHMAVMSVESGEVIMRSAIGTERGWNPRIVAMTMHSAIFIEVRPNDTFVYGMSLTRPETVNWIVDVKKDPASWSWAKRLFLPVRICFAKMLQQPKSTPHTQSELVPLHNSGGELVQLVETAQCTAPRRNCTFTVESHVYLIGKSMDQFHAAADDFVYYVHVRIEVHEEKVDIKYSIHAFDATAADPSVELWNATVLSDSRDNVEVVGIAAATTHLVILYRPSNHSESTKVMCLTAANGTKLWEEVVPHATTVSIGSKKAGPVYVTSHLDPMELNNLTAYKIHDGSLKFSEYGFTSKASKVMSLNEGSGVMLVNDFEFLYLHAKTGEIVYNYTHSVDAATVRGPISYESTAVIFSASQIFGMYTCVDHDDEACGWDDHERSMNLPTIVGACLGLVFVIAFRQYLERTYPEPNKALRPPTTGNQELPPTIPVPSSDLQDEVEEDQKDIAAVVPKMVYVDGDGDPVERRSLLNGPPTGNLGACDQVELLGIVAFGGTVE